MREGKKAWLVRQGTANPTEEKMSQICSPSDVLAEMNKTECGRIVRSLPLRDVFLSPSAKDCASAKMSAPMTGNGFGAGAVGLPKIQLSTRTQTLLVA